MFTFGIIEWNKSIKQTLPMMNSCWDIKIHFMWSALEQDINK